MSPERTRRLQVGLLLICGLVALVWYDVAHGRPLLSPWLIGLLGLLVQAEFLTLAGPGMPRSWRTVAAFYGAAVLFVPFLLGGLHSPQIWEDFIAPSPVAYVLLLTVVWLRTRRSQPVDAGDFAHVGVLMLGFTAFVLPMAFLAAASTLPLGVLFTFTVVIGAKLTDIGAYFIGQMIGRHRLIPGVSPGKTIEGALGGLVVGAGSIYLLTSVIPDLAAALNPGQRLLLALLIAPLGQIGDLLASAVKRAVGTKDSSGAVPGFGGWIDVLDSFIFTAPAGYLLCRAWCS